jgi:hypothetical protein
MQATPQTLIKSALLSLALIIGLSGCASFSLFSKEKPIEIKTKAEERTKLNLPEPKPLELKGPNWIIIHPGNSDQVWKDLEEKGEDVVLFGLTDTNYETLAIMMAELRNFINTQRLIIQQYKKYYEQQDSQNNNK